MLACFLLSSRVWLGWLLALMPPQDHNSQPGVPAPRKATSWWYFGSPRDNPSCHCPGHALSQQKSPVPCLLPHFEAPIPLGGSCVSRIGIRFCSFLAIPALKPVRDLLQTKRVLLSLCPSSCNWIHFLHPAHPGLLPIPLCNDALGSAKPRRWGLDLQPLEPAEGFAPIDSSCTLNPTLAQQTFSLAVPFAPFPFAASFPSHPRCLLPPSSA